jgi:hypothetical protein
MKACSIQPKSHNLNINMYSFRELLELFQLSSRIGVEDIKRAKMMVLKMHPDKSRLPPDYFLFYKKAFDVVYQYYQEQAKTTAEVPKEEQTYSPSINESEDKRTARIIEKKMNDLGQHQFQRKFNELFETVAEKPDPTANEWFRTNDPLFQFDEVQSTAGLAAAMEQVKQKTAALVKHTGVQMMSSSGPAYNNLYDQDEGYVSCDPFGSLKYEDIRKVHKDQTVLAVSESDFAKVRQFSSMDQLQRERGSMNIKHVDRSEHERFFEEQQQAHQEKIAAKQYAAQLKSNEYAEKNKKVMASFLQLTG